VCLMTPFAGPGTAYRGLVDCWSEGPSTYLHVTAAEDLFDGLRGRATPVARVEQRAGVPQREADAIGASGLAVVRERHLQLQAAADRHRGERIGDVRQISLRQELRVTGRRRDQGLDKRVGRVGLDLVRSPDAADKLAQDEVRIALKVLAGLVVLHVEAEVRLRSGGSCVLARRRLVDDEPASGDEARQWLGHGEDGIVPG